MTLTDNNTPKREPVLYYISRLDIPDLNPGKAVAQGMHGAGLFERYVYHQAIASSPDYRDKLIESHKRWSGVEHEGQMGRGFGTTIVLSAELLTIFDTVNQMDHSGMVTDDSYPYRNYYGDVYTAPYITGGWVFLTPHCPEEDWETIKQLPLMK